MNKKTDHQTLKNKRKCHHLKLKDIAHILDIDPANLSRFEKGIYHYPKALVGYHILFDLSIDFTILQFFENSYKEFIHRCFQLLEQLQEVPKTHKNTLRLEGLHTIIARLTKLDEAYGK